MKQTEAQRLADWHKAMADEPKRNESKRQKHRETAAELRRLEAVNAVNAQLLEALQRVKDNAGVPELVWKTASAAIKATGEAK